MQDREREILGPAERFKIRDDCGDIPIQNQFSKSNWLKMLKQMQLSNGELSRPAGMEIKMMKLKKIVGK
jgi:hypothetical protein